MNFQIPILLSVVVCALALPVPDEEVPILQKVTEALPESVTTTGGLEKTTPSLSTVEQGVTTAVGNVSAALPKLDVKSEKGEEAAKETTTEALDDIKEEPKTLPVKAREETEAAAPPFAGVRAEPKEAVEIGESKSKASTPGADEVEKKEEPKKEGAKISHEHNKLTTESTLVGSIEKKSDTPSTEEKPKATEGSENKSTEKPASTETNKTDTTVTTESASAAATTTASPNSKPTNKSDPKPTEAPKEKPSSEANKSEESAESKESEESNESLK